MTMNKQVSVGVQQLIEKLRTQGVASGRTEAECLVAAAREEADRILENARKEANNIVNKAVAEADFAVKSGNEALEMASRNAVLELKGYLMEKFSRRISDAVTVEMKKEDLLSQMIVEVAGRTSLKNEKQVQAILPEKVANFDDLQAKPEKIKEGSLAHFVTQKGKEMLIDGITFSTSVDQKSGITFRLVDKNIEVELDDNAVSDMLLKHLQPRFRTLLEGTIK